MSIFPLLIHAMIVLGGRHLTQRSVYHWLNDDFSGQSSSAHHVPGCTAHVELAFGYRGIAVSRS